MTDQTAASLFPPGVVEEAARAVQVVEHGGPGPVACPRCAEVAAAALASPGVREAVGQRDRAIQLLAEELRRLEPEVERLRLAEVGSKGRDLAFVKEIKRADRLAAALARVEAMLDQADQGEFATAGLNFDRGASEMARHVRDALAEVRSGAHPPGRTRGVTLTAHAFRTTCCGKEIVLHENGGALDQATCSACGREHVLECARIDYVVREPEAPDGGT